MTASVRAPWLTQAWATLSQYQSLQRVPHGLLIQGPQGIGKSELAKHFAAALLCSNPDNVNGACGHCSSCHLLAAGNHPDFFSLESESKSRAITVDQIRSLTAKLALKPQFGQYRIVLIHHAHRMNVAAANALLKTLEEPTERTAMILLSHATVQLPATILSRCHRVNLQRPQHSEGLAWLKQHSQETDTALATALAAAGGSPYLALNMLEKGWVDHYQAVMNDFIAVFFDKKHYPAVAAEWEKTGISDQIIEWLLLLLIDLIQLFETGQGNPFNDKLLPDLRRIVQQCSRKKLYFYLDFLIQRKALLVTQVNQQLMFEELLIHWHELKQSR